MGSGPAPAPRSLAEQHQEQPIFRMPADAMALEASMTLRDGVIVRTRAIRPDDTAWLRAFHLRLSRNTVIARYFGPTPELLDERAQRLAHDDYENQMAMVATTGLGPDEPIIAVIQYDRFAPTLAEVAFVVEDRWQEHGIATRLFYPLAAHARRHGITTFEATVMPDNVRMLNVLRHAGFPYAARHEDGCIEMRLDISEAPSTPRAASSYRTAVRARAFEKRQTRSKEHIERGSTQPEERIQSMPWT